MPTVVAGGDTAAVAMSHLCYFMMRNPHCLDLLRKEIDETFPSGEGLIDFTRLAEMPYLNACMWVCLLSALATPRYHELTCT